MARVPRHFRDKLVSSQTGINTLDTSGAETARAISQMADQFQRVAVDVLKRQAAFTNRSEIASKKAEYVNKSSIAAQEIQKEFAENPADGFEALTRRNQEIKEEVISTVSDGRLQTEIGASIDGLMAQQSVNNKKWEIARMSAMEQQFLVDVQQMNIDSIIQGATAKEYEIMLGDDTFTEENYKRVWGPEEGAKNFQTAQNAMYRARALSLMEQGRFFDAQGFIEQSEEPDEETRREVKESFTKMQKGAVARELFATWGSASIDAVETQEGVLADDLTPSQLEDRALQAFAQAAAHPNPEHQQVLLRKGRLLADIRDMKMENILLRAPGNTTVEARLQGQYEDLINRNNGNTTADPDAYLTDFFAFQEEVVRQAKAGNVSAKHYGQWMYWSKVALEGFDPKGGWFSDRFARDSGLSKQLKSFYNDNPDKSNTWKIDAMREVYERLPTENPGMIDDATAAELFRRGKAVATLKEIGLPIDIIDSKIVRTTFGNFNVVGQDQDGMITVEVPTENMGR